MRLGYTFRFSRRAGARYPRLTYTAWMDSRDTSRRTFDYRRTYRPSVYPSRTV